MTKVKTINGLKEIYNNYDTFILDQWGVMHDGKKGYLKAIECVESFFLANKKMIIISNSSRRKDSTLNRLPSLGFKSTQFEEVMTSGEMIWQSLFRQNYNITKNLEKNCFYIFDETKESGKDFFKGLEKYKLVESIEESDFILGCTPFTNSKVVDYISILNSAYKKNIPFICANPDFETVEASSSGNNIFCMGTVAELYKNMGGRVFVLGKPSIDIYIESTKKINNFKKSRVLAIGDSLHHDIKGAVNYGIDSLLITKTGIHHKLFDEKKLNWDTNNILLQNLDIKPTYLCSEFIF